MATALESAHGERKSIVAAELALLYEMARDPWRASEHFLAAARVSSSRFANREAVAFAKRGLACLAATPDLAEARRRELELQKALLIPLGFLEGAGSSAAERVSQRVMELAEELEDSGSLFAALAGAYMVHIIRDECPAAARISDRMLAIAEQSGSDVQQMNARMWAMIATHHLGELAASQRHADVCIALGTPANQATRLTSMFDPVVATLAESSRNRWMMGDTRGCLEHARRAIQVAREIQEPFSLTFALLFHGWMHGYREDWETCLQSTGEGVSVSTEHGLVQTMAWNRCVHGWAVAHRGNPAEGLVEIEGAIGDSLRISGQVAMSQFAAMRAEVLILRGDWARALEEVQRTLSGTETSRDRYFNAELHRIAAQCHLALDRPEAAEAALRVAIETARSQGARTFELRAATALGRLWAARGEKARANALLKPIYDALGEAEETPDVLRARKCLME